MPLIDIQRETERIMIICNACRYCEGFCAVFSAMERRRTFYSSDLIYLANLCHDCRGCYYACQYAPPHEFGVNVPKTLQELRVKTYMDNVWPGFLAGIFQWNGLVMALLTAIVMILVMAFVFSTGNPNVFGSHHGEGAFYKIIPYSILVLFALFFSLTSVTILLAGVVRFWRRMGRKITDLIDLQALLRATADALRLRYLGGGGHGCNYPGEEFSYIRRRLHHLVFYGFILCFFSTAIAAVYENLMSRLAPYSFLSLPVLAGFAGGTMLMTGAGGLIIYKWQSDRAPSSNRHISLDFAFSTMLFLISLSGLLLLVLRETEAMGLLLTIHFGLVLSFFLTLPYGKFIHSLYRYAALVQNAIEASEEKG